MVVNPRVDLELGNLVCSDPVVVEEVLDKECHTLRLIHMVILVMVLLELLSLNIQDKTVPPKVS